ncbi:hypothetical protein VTK73DRAFT_91 [Phialemonium thermophilum]|uniref:HSF-type DNA-binding domain-containing protein n=1 Tax=Phialemonium thermophilum TaxID=223376 RepID=A0ABR3Y508_9PEZI
MYPPAPSPTSRKRPAPGASPVVPVQQMQQSSFSPAGPEPPLRWDAGGLPGTYVDVGPRNVNPYSIMSSGPATPFVPAIPATPSTVLARRGISQALVPTAARSGYDGSPAAWNSFGDDSFLQPSNGVMDDHDNIELLEERAARAKREAQAKGKPIPPFVQKLSSYLDESKNTDLIRWSEKGDSFIVLDEDEFAKTLIPELFKHNNYASFVRQLNMYGFHKRVRLSDNSMKASERKNKSPSEYYNPYFRRGHPNLLWLISKPKSGSSKKKGAKKGDGEAESEDDATGEEATPSQNLTTSGQVGTRNTGSGEVGPLQKKDLIQVKAQLEKLQQQQVAISQLISQLRRDHNQLVNQAIVFQSMHERHENSINAILNFLANVFRKSLEEQGGAQSVSDLLASIIPGSQQMPQGSVVDLGEFVNQQSPESVAVATPKRQQRLLPPIPAIGKARKGSPAVTSSHTSPQASYPGPPQMGSVTELLDHSDLNPTAYIKNELQTNPRQGMMKIIQDTNAGGTAGIDLPDMASKTAASMTQEQRNQMLDIMARQSSPGSAASVPVTASPAASVGNIATTVPGSTPAGRSLSPVLTPPPPPSQYDLNNTLSGINVVQQLQNDQTSKLDELASILGPLSPSGRIPGLDENSNPSSYFDNVDYEQFLDPVALNELSNNVDFAGPGISGSTDGNDFNFNLNGNDTATGGDSGGVGLDGGQVAESSSTNNSPTSAGSGDFLSPDPDGQAREAKRRRKS